MNKKEATVIIKRLGGVGYQRSDASDFAAAFSYLEAIEKAKGLEEALRTIMKPCGCATPGPCDCNRNLIKTALAEWEKVK